MTTTVSKWPLGKDLHEGLYPFNLTSIRKTLFFLAAVTRSFTCLEFIAKGFSHNTFFPASRNSSPTCQCSVCSTPRYTMSVRTQMLQAQHQTATTTCHFLCLCSKAAHRSQLTNVWVVGQLLIAAVSLRNTMLLGKLFGALQAPRCDGCYL